VVVVVVVVVVVGIVRKYAEYSAMKNAVSVTPGTAFGQYPDVSRLVWPVYFIDHIHIQRLTSVSSTHAFLS
jgi:hypothetical protein